MTCPAVDGVGITANDRVITPDHSALGERAGKHAYPTAEGRRRQAAE